MASAIRTPAFAASIVIVAACSKSEGSGIPDASPASPAALAASSIAPAIAAPSASANAMPEGSLVVRGSVEDFVVSNGEIFWIRRDGEKATLASRPIAGGDEKVLSPVVRDSAGTPFAASLAVSATTVLWYDAERGFDHSLVRAVPRGGGAARTVLAREVLPYPLVPRGTGFAVSRHAALVLLDSGGATTRQIDGVNTCSIASDATTLYFDRECGRNGVDAASMDGSSPHSIVAKGRVHAATPDGVLLDDGREFFVSREGARIPLSSPYRPSESRRVRARGDDVYLLGFFPRVSDAGIERNPPQRLLRFSRSKKTIELERELGRRGVFDVDASGLYVTDDDGIRRVGP